MIERFPQYGSRPKPNTITDAKFITSGNFVDDSARGVIVTGVNNSVNKGCKSISIFNSSGCVVSPGIENVSIFNSSGVIVTESGKIYQNGIDVTISPKKYSAILTQSGTNDPVATVLENTLEGTIVWTRSGIGNYVGTLTGAFTSGKRMLSITGGTVNGSITSKDIRMEYFFFSANEVYIKTYEVIDIDTGTGNQTTSSVDGVMYESNIKIEVYR